MIAAAVPGRPEWTPAQRARLVARHRDDQRDARIVADLRAVGQQVRQEWEYERRIADYLRDRGY